MGLIIPFAALKRTDGVSADQRHTADAKSRHVEHPRG